MWGIVEEAASLASIDERRSVTKAVLLRCMVVRSLPRV
jgi:hypothetical protein